METVVKKMKRKCSLCGKSISVTLVNRRYYNGHYFGKVKIPVGKGKNKKVGTVKFGKHKYDVVKWTGKHNKFEYWECNECYQEAFNEDWLEKKIEKLYGKKCKDYEPHCPCCDAWFLYETILEDNRGEL